MKQPTDTHSKQLYKNTNNNYKYNNYNKVINIIIIEIEMASPREISIRTSRGQQRSFTTTTTKRTHCITVCITVDTVIKLLLQGICASAAGIRYEKRVKGEQQNYYNNKSN